MRPEPAAPLYVFEFRVGHCPVADPAFGVCEAVEVVCVSEAGDEGHEEAAGVERKRAPAAATETDRDDVVDDETGVDRGVDDQAAGIDQVDRSPST